MLVKCYLIFYTCNIFNAILTSGYVPYSFRCGLIIPIPKGKNKNYSFHNNYRKITILSNVSNVLEKLIIGRLNRQENPPQLNSLQGGSRLGHSCLLSGFIFQEATASVRGNKRKVYTAFLDVRKAFDTVWHHALMIKALQKVHFGN